MPMVMFHLSLLERRQNTWATRCIIRCLNLPQIMPVIVAVTKEPGILNDGVGHNACRFLRQRQRLLAERQTSTRRACRRPVPLAE